MRQGGAGLSASSPGLMHSWMSASQPFTCWGSAASSTYSNPLSILSTKVFSLSGISNAVVARTAVTAEHGTLSRALVALGGT